MFPHEEHVWFIDCVFNTPCLTCAFFMHWSCIAHSHLLHTPLLSLSCISLYLVSHWSIPCFFILACHVYLMLCSILFFLLLELHFPFILHPLCIITLVHTLISCPLFSLTLCLFLLKRERVYFFHFYMTLVHILRRRNSISHAHLSGRGGGGRYSIREMHIARKRRHYVNKKTLFCSIFLYVCFLVFFMVLWVMFNINALMLSLHHVCVGHAYILMLLCFFLLHVRMIICFTMWSL